MTEAMSPSAVDLEEESCTLEQWHYTYRMTSHLRGESSTQFIITKRRFSLFLPRPPTTTNKVSIKYVFVAECCCYSITNRWISSAPEELCTSWENSRFTLWPPLCAVCPSGRNHRPAAPLSHGTLGDNLCLHYFLPHVYALLFQNQFNMARLLEQ